jgi:hypothetical protein
MDLQFERRVAQNTAIAAWAIWTCAVSFDKEAGPERKLFFPYCFLVLPLSFHQSTARAVSKLQMTEGSFYRALTQNRTIVVGLQSRIRSLSGDTYRALNLSFASGLLRLDKDEPLSVCPGRKTLPSQFPASLMPQDVAEIIATARRLGYWFATNEFSAICDLLRVRF